MANGLSLKKSKKSKLRRVIVLPRIAVTVDLAGWTFKYKHVPIVETLVNLHGRKWSVQNVLKVVKQQLDELEK